MEAKMRENQEAKAEVDIWKYVFAFAPMAVVKCAIELQIFDTVQRHGGSVTLPELFAASRCPPLALSRIMRYLTHHGFFKQTRMTGDQESSVCYTETPRSRLLTKDGMASLILLESSSLILSSWVGLSRRASVNGAPACENHFWEHTAANPGDSKLFNDAMACHARLSVSAIIDQYPQVFEGIGSLVDVGGGDGTALNTLAKACPWIRGVNFDLPHVVAGAPHGEGVEHVGGDMLQMVPKGDAIFLMRVLHSWSDKECIRILRNCMDAIPKDNGKVIVVETVVRDGEEEDDEYNVIRLAFDMAMMAHSDKGKERTCKEWEYLLNEAGFSKYTVKHIQAVVSVIEAYP